MMNSLKESRCLTTIDSAKNKNQANKAIQRRSVITVLDGSLKRLNVLEKKLFSLALFKI